MQSDECGSNGRFKELKNATEILMTLNQLREQGAITEEEFNAKKAELLQKM